MPRRDGLAPANPVLIAIALLVAALTVVNVISALTADAVWTLSARGFSIDRVARASDPFSFWIILAVDAAALAYLAWDIWRRPRSG